MQEIISQITKEIKKNLLPKLKVFKDFKVIEICRKDDYLGYYKYNTYKKPIIKINTSQIYNSCQEYDTPYYIAIKTTILHELAHAIQDYKEKPFDEEEAEDFAIQYHDFGKILKI